MSSSISPIKSLAMVLSSLGSICSARLSSKPISGEITSSIDDSSSSPISSISISIEGASSMMASPAGAWYKLFSIMGFLSSRPLFVCGGQSLLHHPCLNGESRPVGTLTAPDWLSQLSRHAHHLGRKHTPP